ncbi:porin [Grimontia sp. AD028]|uniref:Porin n=1 Tax=Grimontia sedimenti TaxID=2711294 RepID=A0A6M1RF97_9GAMM|nr:MULTISPECIES: oligogalacturonate-specific porin KdgM family protein [Grimontia]KKD61742.1 porin [Grimontia sp. AD028]NGN96259.1 porin [Grimontia sedimenti]
MKRVVIASAALFMAQGAMASSYVTGNLQFHSHGDKMHGSDATSTLEAGHTFNNDMGGFTLYTEFDGIQIGEVYDADSAYVTLGGEQSFNINENLWVAAGYQHLLHEGDTIQYRPLVKIGYNFDNGVQISNRTRAHIHEESGNDTDWRFDTRIAYAVNSDVALSYNNVYMYAGDYDAKGDAKDHSMDHELRATWTRNGVQPYFEYRNQGDNTNNAFVFGASLSF